MSTPVMKSILLALAITALSIMPAHAVLVGLLLPFHKTSEMVVGIVSRCPAAATYNLVVKNAVNGAVLYRTEGRVGARRGVALPYSFGANQTGSFLRVSVKWECPELDAAKQRPLGRHYRARPRHQGAAVSRRRRTVGLNGD